jgi:Carboxypeptidase regulatory-like domain
MVNDFRNSRPIFFNQYYAARVTVDAAKRHTLAAGLITQIGFGSIIGNVLVTVDGQPYTATSDFHGNYSLKIPVNSTYTLICSKPVFQTKQVPNVVITLGQTTPLNVQLAAA